MLVKLARCAVMSRAGHATPQLVLACLPTALRTVCASTRWPGNADACTALPLQRAARSQISTAVSFEGARAAGSAALPSRSVEGESALSAAEAADGAMAAALPRAACLPLHC